MSDLCEARVWDNGDMTACGKPVVRAQRCVWHIEEEAAYLREKIQEHREGIVRARKALVELLGESDLTSPLEDFLL